TGPRVAVAPHAARRLMPSTRPATCADTPSTLDRDVQQYAAEALRRHLLAIRDRSARDGAVLVADNASGDVLAYVGASGDLSGARLRRWRSGAPAGRLDPEAVSLRARARSASADRRVAAR